MTFFEKYNKFVNKTYTNKYYHFSVFFVLFLILLLAFWLISLTINLSGIYAFFTSHVLTNNEISNIVFNNGSSYGIIINDLTINILDVCTGLFELCVFLALIWATLVVNIKNKIYGSLILIFLFLFFNLVRILAMIWLLLNVNIYLVDILHTILFKIGFFLLFILFYYIWLNTSNKF